MSLTITRKMLFEVMREKKNTDYSTQQEHVFDFVRRSIATNISSENIKYKLKTFYSELHKKWQKYYRSEYRFLQGESVWLNNTINFEDCAIAYQNSHSLTSGRHIISFEKSSLRTKRRKTEHLRHNNTISELAFATHMKLRTAGFEKAAKLVQKITDSTSTVAEEIQQAWKKSKIDTAPKPYTAQEALSLVISTRLSKAQYLKLRKEAKERNCNIYPSYNHLMSAKIDCLPHPDIIKVSESSGEVALQGLLDLTVQRIMELVAETFSDISSNQINLKMYYKWGFDGSGQSRYKQKICDSINDSAMFLTSLVPLKLVFEDRVIWKNPRPSSTRFCRPIRFQFKKETAELAKNEREYINTQISNLRTTRLEIAELIISVEHELFLTMIDGKICNFLTNTSYTQKCFICGAIPKNMNNLEEILKMPLNTNNLQFGISPLHCYIRCFECLLHVAYKLDTKRWPAKGQDKSIENSKKLLIQKKFREEMGLLVDIPKQGGGNTNDGNIARRFFEDASLSSSITGIDENIIRRFNIILKTICSGHKINCDVFKNYCLETANYFICMYSWYPMPVTVHKILIHGASIISESPLPVGILAEDAQEARNKDYRYYREHHTRKCSRIATNVDLLRMLLISSDPIISAERRLISLKRKKLPTEVKELLVLSENSSDSEDTTEDSE